jgi:hypothetical protein
MQHFYHVIAPYHQGTMLNMQIIYERALAAFPLTQHLWLEYARYLEAKLHRCMIALLHVRVECRRA